MCNKIDKMVDSDNSTLPNKKLEEPLVCSDIKRAAIVWGCLSFPYSKLYTIDDIYAKCLRQIEKRHLKFTISKAEIADILKAAFFFSTVVIGSRKGDDDTYQIMIADFMENSPSQV